MLPLGPQDPRGVGEYEITGKLGEGGMGRVYLGRSPGGRRVAVKLARPELAGDPGFRARFRTEVEAARKVGGFHTAQVVDADPDADPPWMVTAFVPGRALDRVVAEDGPLAGDALRALGAALAEALVAVHACGLVHRDLKPSNIIMSDDGPRVLDFGIARALHETRLTTASDVVVGTAGFLAPEQIGTGEIGPWTDVFALGAVLVRAAGGEPFGSGDPMALMYRAVHEPADLGAVPQPLRSIVARCLAKAPAERPTPAEVLAAFAGTARATTTTAPPETMRTAPRRGAPEPPAAPGPSTVRTPPQPGTRHTTGTNAQPPGDGPASGLGPVVFTASATARIGKVLIGGMGVGLASLLFYALSSGESNLFTLALGAAGLALLFYSLGQCLEGLVAAPVLTADTAGLTLRYGVIPSTVVPWPHIAMISRLDGTPNGARKVRMQIKQGKPLPASGLGAKRSQSDDIVLTMPSAFPLPHEARLRQLRDAVNRFAPEVRTNNL